VDIGCGTACIGIALADQLWDSEVTAIDVKPVAVETARASAQSILGDVNNDDDKNARYRALLTSIEDYTPIKKMTVPSCCLIWW
jgi:16S rRNA G1207 methylase RsmC